MRIHHTLRRLLAAAALAVPAAAQAQTDLFSLSQAGNQSFIGLLGFDLSTRDKPIEITRIGAFDDGGDGFANRITVRLWNRQTGAEIGGAYEFLGTQGTLVGSYRFFDLATPLRIEANTAFGLYAFGYGTQDRNYHSGIDPFAAVPFDGAGLVNFHISWFQPAGAGGATQDPINRYGAANFTFRDATITATPEPATIMLVGGGLVVVLAAARRRRNLA